MNCVNKLAHTALFLLALLPLNGNALSLDQVREKGALRVAVYKDFPPYSYLDKGRMQGLDVDIARALAEHLGVGLHTMNVTASDEAMGDDLRNAVWKGHYLGGGTADVMMHVPIDDAFAADNDRTLIFGPYFREEIVIAHDRQQLAEIPDLRVFTREKIGVELATIADTYLTSTEGGQLIDNVVHFRFISEACEGLHNGEIAALMGPRAQLEICIGKDGEDSKRLAVAPVPAQVGLFSWTIGMAVKEQNDDLKEALQQALDALRSDGTLERIFADHGVTYLTPLN